MDEDDQEGPVEDNSLGHSRESSSWILPANPEVDTRTLTSPSHQFTTVNHPPYSPSPSTPTSQTPHSPSPAAKTISATSSHLSPLPPPRLSNPSN
jgi:hypothetical protein